MKCYVLMKSTGEYSDRVVTPIHVYTDFEEAKIICDEKTREYKNRLIEHDNIRSNRWKNLKTTQQKDQVLTERGVYFHSEQIDLEDLLGEISDLIPLEDESYDVIEVEISK